MSGAGDIAARLRACRTQLQIVPCDELVRRGGGGTFPPIGDPRGARAILPRVP